MKACQSIYHASGEIAFEGEWDPKRILAVLDKGNSAFWHGKRVLDIGANTAGLSIEIARVHAEVVAIEPDPYRNTLEIARPIVDSLISEEGLRLSLHKAELLDAHLFGRFDVVLCLGLLYHFRYPQYILDYLSTLDTLHLFISTQTHPGDHLALVNRRDPSVLVPGFLDEGIILTGWHPTRPLFERMLVWAGFGEVECLTDRSVNFPKKPLPNLTNSAYYRAKKVASTDLARVRRQFYPR